MLELFFIVPYFFGKAMENEKRKQIERQIMEEYLQKQKQMEEEAQRAREEAARQARAEDMEAMLDQEIDEEGWVIEKESGYIIGQLVEGDLDALVGKKVGQDGIISDEDGNTIGRVEPVEESSEEEEEEEKEEKTEPIIQDAQELEQRYLKLIQQTLDVIKPTVDRVTPILKTVSWTMGCEERKPEKERDERALMDHIILLIQQASTALNEALQALPTPDKNTSYQSSDAESSQKLADLLSQLIYITAKSNCRAYKKAKGMCSIKDQIGSQFELVQNPLLAIVTSITAFSANIPLLLEARFNPTDEKEQPETFSLGRDERETINSWLKTLIEEKA